MSSFIFAPVTLTSMLDWCKEFHIGELALSLTFGLAISLVYWFTHRKKGFDSSFLVSIVILPLVVCFIILVVGNDISRAISITGVFALTRFRSDPKSPSEITYIFATVAIGLALGISNFVLSCVLSAVLIILLLVFYATRYGEPRNVPMHLRVVIPENLNFTNIFDDLMEKYTVSWKLDKVKTADFGTMFDLNYTLVLKEAADEKAFIDEIRCRNGNLTVTITSAEVSYA